MTQQQTQLPWWHQDGGFFGDLYMRADNSLQTFFEGGHGLEERTEQEVSGVIRLCNLRPGDTIVDCPCGYGRHSVGLAQRGLSVTGVDINNRFLGLARELAQQKGATVDLRHGD